MRPAPRFWRSFAGYFGLDDVTTRRWWEALCTSRMPLAEIAAQEAAHGVPPPLGAALWDKRVVDRVLVHYAAWRGASTA